MNKNKIFEGFLKKLLAKSMNISFLSILILTLSSCGIYRSSFAYQDSKGAPGIPMDKIELMIENGSIERFVGENNQKVYERIKNDQDAILSKKPKKVSITYFNQNSNNQGND